MELFCENSIAQYVWQPQDEYLVLTVLQQCVDRELSVDLPSDSQAFSPDRAASSALSPDGADERHLDDEMKGHRSPKDHIMLITDLGGAIIRANRAVEESLGYSEQDLLGKSFRLLYAPDQMAKAG